MISRLTREQYSEWLAVASGPANVCGNKRKFTTLDNAQQSARARSASYGEMNAYRCPFCQHYHIGHTPPPELFGIELID